MSGYENIYVAYGLWGFATLLAIITLCLLLVPKIKHRQRDKYVEVEEIEVPEYLAEKIFGTKRPEGKIIKLESKKVKKKIDRNGQ